MLVAPLDWGLGHATRCVPIIEKFLSFGFKVIIAATGDQKILIQDRFPELEVVELEGYSVHYGRNARSTVLKIFLQIPKILIAINRENRWLERLLKDRGIDAVFSDNRYGLYHSRTLNVFMTHQLQIQSFAGKWADKWLRRLHYAFIRRFDLCWVPDLADEGSSMGGSLSHPAVLPAPALVYTGPLSALSLSTSSTAKHLLILLSGPEPQRSLFESLLLAQLNHYDGAVVLVRGLPHGGSRIKTPAHVTAVDFLSGPALSQSIGAASFVICRSGYSSIMDLLPAGKKCIMIPTPGQTEQEYLATRLSQLGLIVTAKQSAFDLPSLIRAAAILEPAQCPIPNGTGLEEAVKQLSEQIAKKTEK